MLRRWIPRVVGVGFFTSLILIYKEKIENDLLTRLEDLVYIRRKRNLPKRIILIRHGESQGNTNKEIYKRVSDNCIELTQKGFEQASNAGKRLKELVGNERVEFYLSPYQRTFQTSRTILNHISEDQIFRVDIEPRLREQEFGNTQEPALMPLIRREQVSVGRFWFRFPHGESGADCYNRVASFWTEFRNEHLQIHRPREHCPNVVIITHGLTMRFLLAVINRWSPDTFETVWNPENCDMWVLELNPENGRYYLSEEGNKLRSTRDVLVHFKDGSCKTGTINDYLSIPQPRTEHPVIALKRLGIDPSTVQSIDWWNGKFKSNFTFEDNIAGSCSRRPALTSFDH